MCGIVGIFDLSGRRPIDEATVRRMSERLAHRGPDGDGMHLVAGAGLAHRRLAIIDLAGGKQPLFNEDGTVCVVYNGEIYNFAELAIELSKRGHHFRTHCDTEVVVHAWEEWGEKCVERFCGMFAFALIDERRETVFLARDRLGKKPLYYALLPNGLLLFASELKALVVHPDVACELDPQAVEEYFAFGYVPEPRSIYRNICKLPAAHVMTARRGQASPKAKPYWDVSFAAAEVGDEATVAEELIERLRHAVRARMIADVPLGAFLSGGVDSSAVVAMMADGMKCPVTTFTVSFSESSFDEAPFAAAVAKRYATSHYVDRVDLASADALDRLARIYDEPFADNSALPTLRVCSAARRHVTVALSGDGGDELFAGYRRYRWHGAQEKVRARLPQWVRASAFGAAARLYPRLDWAPRPLRAKATFEELALESIDGYFHNVCVVKDGIRRRLYSPRFRSELQSYRAVEVIARHIRAADTDDPVARAQYADVKTYLPGDILTKVDRASMAVSLEVRAPLLDHEFVAWSAKIPSRLKLNGHGAKRVFKRAVAPYVPAALLARPKQGFSVPVASWLRGPLRARTQALVVGPTLRDSDLFDMDVVRELVDQHVSGRRDHGPVLWSLLSFEAFLREVQGARGTLRPT
jgi:asparagine synthase (glutamine-hydrolysing)